MTLAALLRTRWLPLLLAPLLALVALQAAAQLPAKPGRYGKTLLLDVVLPPSQIDKMGAFLDTLAATSKGTQNSVMFGDTVDWSGDAILANPTTSPYTMVVSVEGTAKAAGDVVTTWKSGWRLETGETRIAVMNGLAAVDAKAGQRVTLTSAAPPMRFDRDSTVAPVLSLVDARNVTIKRVQIQLWSGMGSSSFVDVLMAYRVLLLGVVMLVVVLVLRRL
jgi:hypothetical protein